MHLLLTILFKFLLLLVLWIIPLTECLPELLVLLILEFEVFKVPYQVLQRDLLVPVLVKVILEPLVELEKLDIPPHDDKRIVKFHAILSAKSVVGLIIVAEETSEDSLCCLAILRVLHIKYIKI